MNDDSPVTLSDHLEGIHKALLSLVAHLEESGDARAVRTSLEWSASHLRAAIRALHGEPEETMEGARARKSDLDEVRRNAPGEGLRGHTQAISIPEVLSFVASLQKSGVLRVKTPEEAFLIQLDQGEVIYAVGDNPPEGEILGELLISRGHLCIADLEEVLATGIGEGAMLGSALVASGKVTAENLRGALQFQVQSIFHRVFRADNAVYQFDEGLAMRVPSEIRLSVTKLLLESARTSDEGLRRVSRPGRGSPTR